MPQELNHANDEDLEFRTESGVRYLVQFPVGDWSEDGHGKCDYYFALSDKSVRDVREAHYKISEVLDFGIGDICQNYNEETLPKKVHDTLREMEYEFNLSDIEEGKINPTPEEVFRIWLFLLNKIEPSLKLEKIKMPSINHYGVDYQGRHLNTPGYGLFE